MSDKIVFWKILIMALYIQCLCNGFLQYFVIVIEFILQHSILKYFVAITYYSLTLYGLNIISSPSEIIKSLQKNIKVPVDNDCNCTIWEDEVGMNMSFQCLEWDHTLHDWHNPSIGRERPYHGILQPQSLI